MSRLHALAIVAPVIAGLGAAAAGPDSPGPAACEIRADREGGMVSLEGIVHAATGIEGAYRLRVSKSGGGGSSNIDQGGRFTAGPEQPATVSRVTLGGGGKYVAELEVTPDDGPGTCTHTISGVL